MLTSLFPFPVQSLALHFRNGFLPAAEDRATKTIPGKVNLNFLGWVLRNLNLTKTFKVVLTLEYENY